MCTVNVPASVPSRFSDKSETEARVVSIDLEGSKTAEHVAREQVLSGEACSLNRQPLGLIRRPVSGLRGDRPPVSPGDLAHHRGRVLARLQPRLWPRETRPQQFQQLNSFPARQRGAYPGRSSRLRFRCPHKHMIDRRLLSSAKGSCPTRRAELVVDNL